MDTPSPPAKSILVADDDPEISGALAAFARERGFVVYSVLRGDHALEVATEKRPDVILLDVMMPGLDGRDVLARLNRTDLLSHSIVLFVTARDSQTDRLVGLELGAVDYETKPLHFGRLFDKIERLLAKRARGEL